MKHKLSDTKMNRNDRHPSAFLEFWHILFYGLKIEKSHTAQPIDKLKQTSKQTNKQKNKTKQHIHITKTQIQKADQSNNSYHLYLSLNLLWRIHNASSRS